MTTTTSGSRARLPSPLPTYTECPCTFTSAQTGAQHGLWEAIDIKACNTGPPNTGNPYVSFNSTTGQWVPNTLNADSVDTVNRVCTAKAP